MCGYEWCGNTNSCNWIIPSHNGPNDYYSLHVGLGEKWSKKVFRVWWHSEIRNIENFRVLGCETRDYFTTSGENHFVTLIKVQKMFTCHITGEISTFSEDKLLRKHLILDSILHRNYVFKLQVQSRVFAGSWIVFLKWQTFHIVVEKILLENWEETFYSHFYVQTRNLVPPFQAGPES